MAAVHLYWTEMVLGAAAWGLNSGYHDCSCSHIVLSLSLSNAAS